MSPRSSLGAAAALILAVAACSSSSTPTSGASADGGSGGGSGGSGSGSSSGGGDDGGAWGACSLARVGHPNATPLTLTEVPQAFEGDAPCRGGAAPLLFASPESFAAFTYDAAAVAADASEPDAGALIDWAHQSLLVVSQSTSDALTAGIEGSALVISRGEYCQGVGAACRLTAYAVPNTVDGVVVLACPAPSTPCLAP